MPHLNRWVVNPLLAGVLALGAVAQAGGLDPAAAFEQALSAAEKSLQAGDPQTAERRYGSALAEGWLLLGTLERLEGRLPEAREAFRIAATATADNRRALQSLALVHLQLGEAAEATEILRPLARENRKDLESRRLLAQALLAGGRPAQAVQELEDARAAAPDDLELAFALAGAYLAAARVDDAARVFTRIVEARPIPQTRLLIARTYRDFGQHERARDELRAALKQHPRARYAHYYLGMLAVQAQRAALEEGIREFRAELELAPADPLANLELGVALAESQRPAEALPALEIAARSGPPQSRAFYYLGRSQLALDRPAEAAASLKRALELAQAQGANAPALRAIHTQLGQALRTLGRTEESAVHFAESARLSAEGTEAERENLARYMADAPDPEGAKAAVVPLLEASPLAELPLPQRRETGRRVRAGLARAYLNLGIMQAQGEQFARAAELLEKAAELNADLPRVQYSLGVAHFNAKQYDKATQPLSRALSTDPGNTGLQRMLAMAWLNSGEYGKAAELLRGDPELDADPSLQFAYGLSLVRSERAAEAEQVFAKLLSEHGDSAELSVLLGQAHAQQGDYAAAVGALERALRLKADVAEANATLGVIYLKQGKLAEAEAALRAELRTHPSDVSSQQNLAIVLDSLQRREEAIEVLRRLLESKPDLADARYLLGKALLAQGAAAEAAEQLEAAARLAPDDANIRHQLGQAYQKLGRTEQAQREFETFRRLKDKTRNAP